jgi:hypothetical protein
MLQIPMPVPEIVTLIKDLALSGAAIVTATVAIRGLKSWNRELKGKAAFEVARALARSTYKLRDAIKGCRSPVVIAAEFPDGFDAGRGKRAGPEVAEAYAHVYNNRFGQVWGALQEFDTNTLEAEALWGNDVRANTDALRHCVVELRTAIDAFIGDKESGGRDFSQDAKFAIGVRSTVSNYSGDENELTKKVVAAIQNIEGVVRPHLKRA